jgi:hypothetical protein
MIKRLIQRAEALILIPAILASVLAFREPNKSSDKEIPRKQTIERLVENPTEENIEQIINDKFKQYFKKYSFDGKEITLNIPFGENGERSVKDSYDQTFCYSGKASPRDLWGMAENILNSSRFKGYISELKKQEEKIIALG